MNEILEGMFASFVEKIVAKVTENVTAAFDAKIEELGTRISYITFTEQQADEKLKNMIEEIAEKEVEDAMAQLDLSDFSDEIETIVDERISRIEISIR